MAVVYGNLIEDNKLKVMSIAYLTNDTSNGGIQVDTENIPEYPPPKVGINHIMYINPTTKDIWFEIEIRELTPEESQKMRLTLLEKAVEDLILGGM